MDRRSFLALLSVGVGGVVIAESNTGDLESGSSSDESSEDEQDQNQPTREIYSQGFGMFSPGFEKIEFQRVVSPGFNGYLARITFGSHSMDAFGIRHRSHDSIEDDIYICTAPKSTGTREVPLTRALNEENAVYPNREFDLVAYEGEFQGCGDSLDIAISTEQKGSASFTVPEEIAPASAFRDITPTD